MRHIVTDWGELLESEERHETARLKLSECPTDGTRERGTDVRGEASLLSDCVSGGERPQTDTQ